MIVIHSDQIPSIGIFEMRLFASMATNSSILLGDYFAAFISEQKTTGERIAEG
jgi:hypothetical protein